MKADSQTDPRDNSQGDPQTDAGAPCIRIGNIRAVPSLHGRIGFASLVRQAFYESRPAVIAVELPATLAQTIEQGVGRLPFLSVVAYDDFDADLEKVTRIVPIAPEDSLIEAVRLGQEENVPVHFIDRDILHHQAQPVRAPDDYLLQRIGLERYYRTVLATLAPPAKGSPDDLREIEMAAHLNRLSRAHDSVLLVCGLAHLDPILKHMQAETAVPPGAVTQREQVLYNIGVESVPYALQSIPFLVYGHELARRGLDPLDFPQLLPFPLARGHEYEAAREAYGETKHLLLEKLRSRKARSSTPDTYRALTALIETAVDLYRREWRETPSPSRLTTLLRFARNMALVQKRLTPTKYLLALAAKNTVNDDFAFQTVRLADHYPFIDENSDLPELKMEEGRGEAAGEELTLRLRLPPSIRDNLENPADLGLQPPTEELAEGSWQERWEIGERHVSYLPQDDRIETFFQYIREKCRTILSDQRVRSQEFQASMLDGLDIRETLRNLPRGKVYVKEKLPGVGEVGPIVVIFHKPGEEKHYPHKRMWYAEHSDESDLALYSTDPGREFDGPGISRCQYGGVLSLYPPTGRAVVWENPRYEGGGTAAEHLLKAAIDLSRKPIVGYVAAQGPNPEMLALAASRGIHIMYVPLDSLSADSLKRVRTFHVLADRDIRPLAPVYIN